VLDELPFGGMGLVQKWYCADCTEELIEDAKGEDSPTEPDEDEKTNSSTRKARSSRSDK